VSISSVGEAFWVEFAMFNVADKEDLYPLIGFLDTLSKYERTFAGEEATYHIDTTEIDNIKSVRNMLIVLFPIALAAAVLTGLVAPLLIIMQSSKEAAILRILGTTKLRTRCMFAIEQISLCIIGLSAAAVGLVLYNSGLIVKSAVMLTFCGGLYLLGCLSATVFAVMAVTHRRAIELLQVKE